MSDVAEGNHDRLGETTKSVCVARALEELQPAARKNQSVINHALAASGPKD